MRSVGRIDYRIALLLLSVAAVVTYVYVDRLPRQALPSRVTLHDQIIEGTALSPYRYRVLVPVVAGTLMRVLPASIPSDRAFVLAYAICDLSAVSLLLLVLLVWLRGWFSPERSLIGVLYVAATMPIALQDHYYQPWSLPEAGLFTAALIAIRDRRYGVLTVLVAVASLNRETAVFIPLALLATSVDPYNPFRGSFERRPVLVSVALLGLWLAVFVGLRLVRGDAAPVATVGGLLQTNLDPRNLLRATLNGGLFLGAFWLFAVLGFRSAPAFLKRLTLVIPPYLAAIVLWGIWHEVRLLMPLYAILVPLGLSFLFAGERPREGPGAASPTS